MKFEEQNPLAPSGNAPASDLFAERARSNAIDFVDNPYLKVDRPGESRDQNEEIVVIDKDSSRQGVMLAAADGAYTSESDDECGAYQTKLNK